MHDLSIQGLEPLTEEKATHTDYITVTDVSDDLEELLSILPNSINSLKDVGMYNEWINYIRILGSNEFPLKNIAHLLFLDVCRWYQCGNTVSMRYSPPEIKHFWLLGYKLFHGKFFRFMAGFRHGGYVKDGSNACSFYNPTDTSKN